MDVQSHLFLVHIWFPFLGWNCPFLMWECKNWEKKFKKTFYSVKLHSKLGWLIANISIFADNLDPMCLWDRDIYAWLISFYLIFVAHPLYVNQTRIRSGKSVWMYILPSYFWIFFQHFLNLFHPFLLSPLIWGNFLPFLLVCYFFKIENSP